MARMKIRKMMIFMKRKKRKIVTACTLGETILANATGLATV